MSLQAIIALLGVVSTLLGILKELPQVVDEAKSLLGKVRPFIEDADDDIKAEFAHLSALADAA